jgi:predicted AlkP superfamily pyrophosphatase or phosphodiesterase
MMAKKQIFIVIIIAFLASIQTENLSAQPFVQRTKLVVGIVVDQMRQDYLTRFWDLYSEGGFKKLVNEGYSFPNAHFNYFPTFTGAGHANISTGASPSINGIVGNDWYELPDWKKAYCAEDKSVSGVGTDGPAGQMSPRKMLTTTIGDELKLASNNRARVFGIAIKDRGAILSAGHNANAAFWFDGSSGDFITSSYYMASLPKWVADFNRRKGWSKYLDGTWRTSIDIRKLAEVAGPDDSPFENVPKGMTKAVFPYNLKNLRKEYGPELLSSTPWGNTYTFDFAKALIREERLGKGLHTDLLFVSLSSTDYIGHFYGPRSMEVADMYIKLDQDIADFLRTLEQQVGKDNLLVFLSSDHGVADNPSYAKAQKIPAGQFNLNSINIKLRAHLEDLFGADLIDGYKNYQIFLHHGKIKEKGLDKSAVEDAVVDFLMQQDGVLRAFPSSMLSRYNLSDELMIRYQRGYFPSRCGDVYLVMQPGWLEMYWQDKGTTHGSPYTYDTHVPIIFYGKGVPSGHSFDYASVSQIAPTIAALLGIAPPNGSFDQPLLPNFRK